MIIKGRVSIDKLSYSCVFLQANIIQHHTRVLDKNESAGVFLSMGTLSWGVPGHSECWISDEVIVQQIKNNTLCSRELRVLTLTCDR